MAFRLFLVLSLFCCCLPALAWSPLGHRLVGELAQPHLTQKAQAEVAKLLSGEPQPTLGGVANWADTLRDSDPDYFKRTSRWHYINTPPGTCDYVAERDCKDGDCVIGAIEKQRAVLADPSQSLVARRDALKFLVHFVGDAHQPLHNNNHDDRGGNQYQISLRTTLQPEAYARDKYINGIMGTNLHAVWDYYVLGESRRNPRVYATVLRANPWPPAATALATPVEWSRESCLLVDGWSIYPQGHTLDHSYADAMRPLAERRIQQAAYRLADLLNQALAR